MPTPRVIDISRWNTVASFADVTAAGIWGVINKASEGTGYVDPTYAPRRPQVKQHGLLWGAYHFFRAEMNVSQQVEHFLRAATPDEQTLLALDWETAPAGTTPSAGQAREFCERVFNKVGRRPIIYSGNTAKERLGSMADSFFGQHRLWLAQYASRPVCQRSWSTAWLWQYSGDDVGPLPHGVNGVTISGRRICDMNDYVLDDGINDPEIARQNLSREWVTDAGSSDQKPSQPQDQKGSRTIAAIQKSLNNLGFTDDLGRVLVVDGDYGPRTTQAVKKFQKAHPPLRIDGVFGPLTSAMLDFVLLQQVKPGMNQ